MSHKILTGFHDRVLDAEFFAKEAENSKSYLEYGSGSTTIYVDKFTNSKALIVENDLRWVEAVSKHLTRTNEVKFIHVDLGPCGGWGYPLEVEKYKSKFSDYYVSPWNLERDFDLILVDGRFRVATFLYSLMNCDLGTVVLFDDYKERDYYHAIEELIKPTEICQSLAKFVKNQPVDDSRCLEIINQYSDDLR